jgi:homoaconitate hydratase family protein/3-isopropylmalate dehydratase small subunit
MGMTITEKILAAHCGKTFIAPGEIVDVTIDARVARDFGGANVVKHLEDKNLDIDDPERTFFTFDCNPTGSDQKYAVNQHICRVFGRNRNIRIYDIHKGIGTHILIEEGLAFPGSTAVSTDSHANIIGAVGAFGQGMGDQDIAAAWHSGKVWFKVPETVKIVLKGALPDKLSAKDIALNLLHHFGADGLLGYAAELYGDGMEMLGLDDRITIASMATEMGAIILLFPPNKEVMRYCESRTGKRIEAVYADRDANYTRMVELDASSFIPRISLPGKPHDTVSAKQPKKIKIDSAFIGSCTNGRLKDLRVAAAILKGRSVAPGVVLKIVPATDLIWQQSLEEGLIEIFKEAGAMVSNAGCAGCAAGQVGQNGVGEVTVSTGNRNFHGKQGKGDVYLASPAVVAASAIAGFITTPDAIPDKPELFMASPRPAKKETPYKKIPAPAKPLRVQGKARMVLLDNVDTDMIFHNRYLTITELAEMGKYTFDNLPGFERFAQNVQKGDILFTGRNFGSGSSRQQAVDCFISLGIQVIVAGSFGAIYERNAINAGLPVLVMQDFEKTEIVEGNEIKINFETGEIENLTKKIKFKAAPFSDVQKRIYRNNGLL